MTDNTKPTEAPTTPEEKPKPVVLKWEGDTPQKNPEGRYMWGVPQRDLTADDMDVLPEGINKKALLDSGLYSDPTKK